MSIGALTRFNQWTQQQSLYILIGGMSVAMLPHMKKKQANQPLVKRPLYRWSISALGVGITLFALKQHGVLDKLIPARRVAAPKMMFLKPTVCKTLTHTSVDKLFEAVRTQISAAETSNILHKVNQQRIRVIRGFSGHFKTGPITKGSIRVGDGMVQNLHGGVGLVHEARSKSLFDATSKMCQEMKKGYSSITGSMNQENVVDFLANVKV